jgi:hypothetical protein
MHVEAAVSKGGYMLNLLERFVGAVEKFADVADRAVKLEEYKQDLMKMHMLETSFPSTPEAMAEALVRQKQFRERHR